jgi:hypothetical protein
MKGKIIMTKNTRDILEGKFLIHDQGESLRTGEIKAKIDDNVYLIVYDVWEDSEDDDPPPLFPMALVHLNEMATPCDHCRCRHWKIFNTAADRQAWLDWILKEDESTPDDHDHKLEDNLIPMKSRSTH